VGARPKSRSLGTIRLANMCEKTTLRLMIRWTANQHHLSLLHTSVTHSGLSFKSVGHASNTSFGIINPSTFVHLVFILAAL
jgi:hypothetical protein